MKGFSYFIGLFLLFHHLSGRGQENLYKGNPENSFIISRDLAFAGNRKQAADTLKQILTVYPTYTEARNLLGKIHSWDGEYDAARKEFNKITSLEKQNKEVWIASINNELYAENYATALGLSIKALYFLKADKDVELLRQKALEDIHTPQDKNALLINQTESEPLKATSTTGKRKNSVGIYSAIDLFDVVFDPMVASGLEYKRETEIGSIIPRINYAHRFAIDGLQYEIDFYPKFSKTFYAYVNYGFSKSPIFPDHRAGGEFFANLPNAWEASLGGRYLKFNEVTAKIITGSAGWYTGNYYLSFRPYITLPEAENPMGFSGSILARKYLKDKDNYFGINTVVGYAPELKQLRAGDVLLSQTLLHIASQQVNLEYQFTGISGDNVYRANLGLTRQELAFDPGKFFWAVSAGFTYRFKF